MIRPHKQFPVSWICEWNPRISMSNKFPGDAVATGPGITLQELQCGSQIAKKYLKLVEQQAIPLIEDLLWTKYLCEFGF